MSKLALGALFAGVAAACSGGTDSSRDAGPGAVLACNPIAQTGCMANEKCTWIVDVDPTPNANEIGHIGCVAAGTIPDGADCPDTTVASNAGADTCVGGDLCMSGRCKRICDPQLVDGAASGACAASFTCSTYAGVFVSAGDPVAGVSEPNCEPLTQKLVMGTTNIEACGSPAPAAPTATCVPGRGFRTFHCAPTDASFYPNTDRVVPHADAAGNIYDNGCAPGFIPFYVQDADAGYMTTLCSGMCAPVKTDMTNPSKAAGDPATAGKLTTDPSAVAGKSTCNAGVKGSIPADPTGKGVEDCRFVWFPLAKGDPTKALQTPYNDTLGICFAYQKYLTVTIPGMPQKFPEKSCAELPVTAPTNDPYGSARDNGCYPLADSLGASVRQRTQRAPSYRLANGAGPAVRHVFD
jgi:hypothetical protein